eukprot:9547565-Alexandrium_andersonii.AAC.1
MFSSASASLRRGKAGTSSLTSYKSLKAIKSGITIASSEVGTAVAATTAWTGALITFAQAAQPAL